MADDPTGPGSGADSHEPPEPLLTVAELAEMLRVVPRTLRRWRRKQHIVGVKIAGTLRYRLSDVLPR